MISETTSSIDAESDKKRRLRYTIDAAALTGTIVLITWILGKVIGTLHALVFSLALAEMPGQLLTELPMPEDTLTNSVVQSNFQGGQQTSDDPTLHTFDQRN